MVVCRTSEDFQKRWDIYLVYWETGVAFTIRWCCIINSAHLGFKCCLFRGRFILRNRNRTFQINLGRANAMSALRWSQDRSSKLELIIKYPFADVLLNGSLTALGIWFFWYFPPKVSSQCIYFRFEIHWRCLKNVLLIPWKHSLSASSLYNHSSKCSINRCAFLNSANTLLKSNVILRLCFGNLPKLLSANVNGTWS